MLGQICKTTAVLSYGVAHKTVIPSAQVRFEGTYGHVLIHKLLSYGFEVVLVIFEKSR